MPVTYVNGGFRHYGEGPYPIRVEEADWLAAIARWQGRIAEGMPMEQPCNMNDWTGRIWVNDRKNNARA